MLTKNTEEMRHQIALHIKADAVHALYESAMALAAGQPGVRDE